MEVRKLKNSDGVAFYALAHVEGVDGLTTASATVDGLLTASDKRKLDNTPSITQTDIDFWNSKQDTTFTSPDGSKFRLLVDNNGNFISQRV
ncbi:CCA-adding enzyme [Listeria booriae]|uniref:CCA-adding enzyme n=1 Tax=Listeria booriae TaxID=1552123 RepID=UPI001628D895|nr:CCA-adding enzyme [Listeria booriae]